MSVAVVGLTPVKADEPVLKGSVGTPNGVPAKSYPVIIKGTTVWGKDYSSFVTTDDEGAFVVMHLPPGKYTAAPAGQPESGIEVIIRKIPWYKVWASRQTRDVGDLNVALGKKLRSQ